MQIKYSIILPCYNEYGNLKLLIPQILTFLKKKSYEILIIDDNSSDNTAERLKKKLKKNTNINYIVRKKNRSLGLSIKDGIKTSKGEIIIVMDSDFNHRPLDLKKMLHIYENKNVDMVCGSRFLKGGFSSSFFRHTTSLIFNQFIRIIIDGTLTDNFSGFFIIKKKLILRKIDMIFYGYGEYYIRMLFFLQKKKIIIKEVPVKYGKRKYGASKSKLIKMLFTYTFHALKLIA